MFSKHSSSGWILLMPTLSLLKYFDIITWPRHKSSKIEGSFPPLKIYSIKFHCVGFRFSTVSKRETIYKRCHMKGIPVQSHLQSFAGNLIIGGKSQKIDLNRLIRQRIFRFLKKDSDQYLRQLYFWKVSASASILTLFERVRCSARTQDRAYKGCSFKP